jgi:hypothetical protein
MFGWSGVLMPSGTETLRITEKAAATASRLVEVW